MAGGVGGVGCADADRKRPYFPDRPAIDKPWTAWVQFEVYYRCSSGFNQADAEIITWVSVLPANPRGTNVDSKSGFPDVVPGKNETRTFHHALTRLGLWIGARTLQPHGLGGRRDCGHGLHGGVRRRGDGVALRSR